MNRFSISPKALVALPLVGTLALQYALAAPLLGSASSRFDADGAQAGQRVVYEVTVQQDGQLLATNRASSQTMVLTSGQYAALSVEEEGGVPARIGAASSQGESEGAVQAFMQSLSENDAVARVLNQRQSTTALLNGAIGRRIVQAKVASKQASQLRAQQFAADRAAERAQAIGKLKVDGKTVSEKQATAIAAEAPDYQHHITYINQRKTLPSGCEIVALTVVLKSMGFDASETDIADNHLKTGGDNKTHYTGSPYTNGGGYPPCIVDAANSWLEKHDGAAKAYDLTGTDYKDLKALVELGYPVLAWTTEAMTSPSVYSDWYNPEHCVVLYGFEGDKALVSDSLEGLIKRDDKRFGEIYEKVGKHAAFVQPQDGR